MAMQGASHKHKNKASSPRDDLHNWLGKRPPRVIVLLAIMSLGLTALLDHLTSYEISFSLFYLAPVALAAWYGEKHMAMAIAVLAACIWFLIDQAAGHVYSSNLIAIWNALVRLGFFVITAYLLILLKRQMRVEYELARSDVLTGLLNGRAFRQELQRSIDLALRSSTALTLAYIDVDNFKVVNDTQGHGEGDKLLQAIGGIFTQAMRATDYAARLGGDEFGIVLPATEAEGGEAVMDKLRQQLDARVAAGGWPVSFSIGVITLRKVRVNVDEALKLADALMYEVKRAGKNAMRHRVL